MMRHEYFYSDQTEHFPGVLCRVLRVDVPPSQMVYQDHILDIDRTWFEYYRPINNADHVPDVDHLLLQSAHKHVFFKAAEQATILLGLRLLEA